MDTKQSFGRLERERERDVEWVSEEDGDRRERERSGGVSATEGWRNCSQGFSHSPLLCSSFDQSILCLLFQLF